MYGLDGPSALATDPGGVLTFEQCVPGRDHGWLGRDLQLLGSGLRDSQNRIATRLTTAACPSVWLVDLCRCTACRSGSGRSGFAAHTECSDHRGVDIERLRPLIGAKLLTERLQSSTVQPCWSCSATRDSLRPFPTSTVSS